MMRRFIRISVVTAFALIVMGLLLWIVVADSASPSATKHTFQDLKKRALASKKKLEKSFARAYVALASTAHFQSMESWVKKKAAKAGTALTSANLYLKKRYWEARQKIENNSDHVIKKGDDISRQITNKVSSIVEEARQGLKDAGNKIENFGKNISSR